jgi:hypothetical protein
LPRIRGKPALCPGSCLGAATGKWVQRVVESALGFWRLGSRALAAVDLAQWRHERHDS